MGIFETFVIGALVWILCEFSELNGHKRYVYPTTMLISTIIIFIINSIINKLFF